MLISACCNLRFTLRQLRLSDGTYGRIKHMEIGSEFITAYAEVWKRGRFLMIWLTRNFPIAHDSPATNDN